jgi:Ketopantoate reductase PanE/ApbA
MRTKHPRSETNEAFSSMHTDNSVETSILLSLTTCVVGGGSTAHTIIPFLSEAGHHVNLLTRRPRDWNSVVYSEITDGVTGKITATHAGCLDKASSDPADVIPDADIIVLCLPVHQYRPALARIAPFINRHKEVFVGTVSSVRLLPTTIVCDCHHLNLRLNVLFRSMVKRDSTGWFIPSSEHINLPTLSPLQWLVSPGSVERWSMAIGSPTSVAKSPTLWP